MEALQRKPLAFSSGDNIVSASSRIPLNTKDGSVLNIEIFDGNTSESSPILLVTHGICESAETLGIQAIVAKAEDHSVKVAVLELQGHGLSSGQKGVCGDFDLLLSHFLEFVQVSVPELRGHSNAPFFITGNSLGGTIAIYAAEKIANDKKSFSFKFQGSGLNSTRCWGRPSSGPILSNCTMPKIPFFSCTSGKIASDTIGRSNTLQLPGKFKP